MTVHFVGLYLFILLLQCTLTKEKKNTNAELEKYQLNEGSPTHDSNL